MAHLEELKKKKQEEEESKSQTPAPKTSLPVSKVVTKSHKRSNIVKVSKAAPVTKKPKTKAKQVEEIKEDEVTPVSEPVPESNYLDLSADALAELKSKILTKVYQDFLDTY